MFGLYISHLVAQFVIALSMYSALSLAALLLVLVIRRDAQERHLAARQARLKQLTRSILRADEAHVVELARSSRADELLEASLHLYQLLKGAEQERLTAFVERLGLLARLETQLQAHSAARRVDAIRTFERIGSPRAITLLTQTMMRDRMLAVRLEAAAGLSRLDALPKPAVIVAVLDMETRAVTPQDQSLLRSLAIRYPSDLINLHRRKLPLPLQRAVVEVLGWIPNFGGLSEIRQALESDDPEIRCAALRAARKMGHPAVRTWVTSLLEDREDAVRVQAVSAAGALKLRTVSPMLEQLTHDSSPWVRLRAKEALVKMGRDTKHA